MAKAKNDAATGNDTTAEKLLPLAAALFHERGFSATSTRELAEHLGIQRASLYHHIRSKEDLLFAISMESLAHIQAAVESVPEEPGGRLRAAVRMHLVTALSERDMHSTMLTELRALTPERRGQVIEQRAKYEALLSGIIAEEHAAGRVRDDLSPRRLTLALLNLLNWTIFWFDVDGEMSVHDVVDLLSTVYFDGVMLGPRSTGTQQN
jgi:AcrR family transcriptional regulator